jgi:mono/diheme cytochrome c family protein
MWRPGIAWAISLTLTGCSGGDAGLPPEYRQVSVPEAQLRSVDARARGRALFRQHCALCHGENADGRGARREGLSTRPRDFTDPAWRLRSSPRAVYAAIREGVRGTAMPSWRSLEVGETWDLVAFLLSAGESGTTAKEGHDTPRDGEGSAR